MEYTLLFHTGVLLIFSSSRILKTPNISVFRSNRKMFICTFEREIQA